MAAEIVLRSDAATVAILPERGAAMSRYDYRGSGEKHPLLTNPEGRVNLLMAPWQNRISGGGFDFGGERVSLAPNIPNERFPLHGNAWLQPWAVDKSSDSEAVLTLVSDGPAPYRYRAELTYRLSADGSLETIATVTNSGPTLPFGLGFHPYFTRTVDTLLQAQARTVVLQDPHYMPTDTLPVSAIPRWNFNTSRALPEGWINNEFAGWNGVAEITWPGWGIGCRLESPDVTRYLVYSPRTNAPYFCFEPITHTVDAHNLSQPMEAGGLKVLAAGESMTLRTSFHPYRL